MSKRCIAFVINNLLVGGVERFVFDLASSLQAAGDDVVVYTVLGSGPLEEQFRQAGTRVVHAGREASYARRFGAYLPFYLVLPVALWRLRRSFRKEQPDVVVTSLWQADVLGMLAARATDVPVRLTIQHDRARLPSFVRWLKRRIVFPRATSIVANSMASGKFLESYWSVLASRITVIPNGVSSSCWAQAKKPLSQPLRLLTLLAIPCMIGGVVLAREIIHILYGAAYDPAVNSFIVVNFTYLPVFLAGTLGNAIFAINKEKSLIPYVVGGIIGNILLDLLLIPIFGIAGASLSTVINQFVITGYLFWRLRTYVPFKYFSRLKKIGVASAVLAIVFLVLHILHAPIYVTLAAGVVAYGGTLLVLKEETIGYITSIVA